MKYFAISARDRPGAGDLRRATKPSHKAYLDAGAAEVTTLQSGPLLDDEGAEVGSLVIVGARDLASARSFSRGDPYVEADLFADRTVSEWAWKRGNPHLDRQNAVRDAVDIASGGRMKFVYHAATQRVVFAAGCSDDIAREADKLGLRRMAVISTPGQRQAGERILAKLGEFGAGCISVAVMHTPVEITERALADLGDLQADGLVAVGGGSAIGLAKAIALRTDLPQIALPTTYAGSEMTDLIGQTSGGVKTTERSERVRPEVVMYDADLGAGLPPRTAALSGMNAMAHAVEALYAPDANPITSLMAIEGISALHRSLPRIGRGAGGDEDRSQALYGAWLCGTCLGSVTMGLHHKLCHVLGGRYDLPHAETHSVLLPHVLAFNAEASLAAMNGLQRAFGNDDPVAALMELQKACSLPSSLIEIGMPQSGVDECARIVADGDFRNPRSVNRKDITSMLERAFSNA